MTAKDKDRKLLLILGSVAVVLCLVAVGWHLAVKRGDDKPNPIRPKDFPQILVAPEGAVLLDHSTPWNRRSAPHTYGFSFVVEDPYPSEKTRNFIEDHLESRGWRRLKYHLLNPDVPASHTPMLGIELPLTVPESLNPESVNMLLDERKWKGEDYPVRYIMEDWVSEEDQHIDVTLYYRADLSTRRVHRDKVHVDLGLFKRESWIRPWVLRYKELHPEEFQDGNDL